LKKVEWRKQYRCLKRLLTEDPERLSSLHELARAYLEKGRVEEAIPLFEEVVGIEKVKPKPEDPSLLLSLHYLASAYLENGRVEEAITLLKEVFGIEKVKLKPEDPERQLSENLLAEALRRREDVQQDTSSA
jgi:cytochrome c-type biogenesis protein CcmH/NrfG